MTTFFWMTSAADRATSGSLRAGAARLLPLLFVLLFVPAAVSGCAERDRGEVVRLSGGTMGTTWHVTVVTSSATDAQALGSGVQKVLDGVNAAMSTYLPESDLSRFNRAAVNEVVAVSQQTLTVTQAALAIAQDTGQAFNPAVAALVELWGFGSAAAEGLPDAAAIEEAMASTNLEQLQVDPQVPALSKRGPLRLDYSAIAKGYGVDEVAAWLEQRGFEDYLVEVGGELRTAGVNPEGHLWRVGIEKPLPVPGQAQLAIAVSGQAVATSGDYRNYREVGGKRFSHEIDPRTGRPAENDLVSASVITESAMLADGYATALMIMGSQQALRFANQRALPVYLLVKNGNEVKALYSDAFRQYIE